MLDPVLLWLWGKWDMPHRLMPLLPVWAATITMYAPLVPIISTNPKTLLLEMPAK